MMDKQETRAQLSKWPKPQWPGKRSAAPPSSADATEGDGADPSLVAHVSAASSPGAGSPPFQITGMPPGEDQMRPPSERADVPAPAVGDGAVGQPPPEFLRLFAAVERQVAGVADETLMGYQTLGTVQPYVLGVTSALVGEGKTTVAIQLALSTARSTFKRVGLLDLSLGPDVLCERLGIPSTGEGIVLNLEGASQNVRTVQIPDYDNLVIIPSGRPPANAGKLARSPQVADLIVAARQAFDIVIVDLPAVARDHVLPLTQHLDGLLLVTRAGVTPREVVNHAVQHLGRKKVIGVTLNRVRYDGPDWLRHRLMGRGGAGH